MSATDGVYFSSTKQYILSANSIADKIIAIDKVIEAMFLLMLEPEVIEKQYISEYSLDDGQTKIKTVYRDLVEINNAIIALEKELERMYNKLNGRMVRLTDGKNFKGNRFNGR